MREFFLGCEAMVGLRILPQQFPTPAPSSPNGHGNHPLRWDRSGMVMECLPHQAYAVKVDGSSRVSKRMRGHLRPIVAHDHFDHLGEHPMEEEELDPPLPQAPQMPQVPQTP